MAEWLRTISDQYCILNEFSEFLDKPNSTWDLGANFRQRIGIKRNDKCRSFHRILFWIWVETRRIRCRQPFETPNQFNSTVAKECTHYSSPDKYSTFIDLFTLKDAQPQDYLARIPFYVHGHRDAYIVLSPKKNPDWNADNVYEIRKILSSRELNKLGQFSKMNSLQWLEAVRNVW